MTKLEVQTKKRKQRAAIKKIILNTVAVAGLLSVALVAPNVLGAMAKAGMLPHKQQKSVIDRSRERLLKHGFLKYIDGRLQLTDKGVAELQKLERANFSLKKPKKWDGLWRVLIFDVPESMRSTREKLRRTLRSVGFIRLQDSVWLYPYDCEDFVVLLKSDFKIGKNMLYLIVESMENDLPHKKHFGLA